jgi:hypothetical protein
LLLVIASITWIVLYVLNAPNQSTELINRASWILLTVPTAIWMIGATMHYLVKRKIGLRLPYPLYYRLDSQRLSRFSTISRALETLSRSHQILSVKEGKLPAHVNIQTPPHIVTNVDPWAITILNWKMFFMPDSIYIFKNGTYSTVSYENLRISHSERTEYATHGHPSDATVVDRTWLHTRKDGYPDRRYSYNPSIPIVLYDLLTIEEKGGWSLILQISNRDAVHQSLDLFASAIPLASNTYKRSGQRTSDKQTDDNQKRQSSPKSSEQGRKSPYDVLGVRENAPIEEITAAYRKQAQMNHPDRVASMAPEFRDLAERRMKEINAAYDELRRRHE